MVSNSFLCHGNHIRAQSNCVNDALSCVGNNLKCSLSETCCSEEMEDVLMYNRSTSQNIEIQLQLYGALDECFSNSDFEGK